MKAQSTRCFSFPCKARSIYMTWWTYPSQILWFLFPSPKLFSGWDETFGSEMYFQNWRGRKKCDWLGWDSLGPAKRQKDEKAEICWRGWQTQFVLSILFSLLFSFSQTHSLQKDFYKKRHRHRFHIQNTLRSLKGWGLSAKLGKHSVIWGKLGTALQAYTLNPCTKFPPNPTSRKVNT